VQRKITLASGEQSFEVSVQASDGDGRVAIIGEERFEISVEPLDDAQCVVICNGERLLARYAKDGNTLFVQLGGRRFRFEEQRGGARRGGGAGADISAPMPGAISRILVAVGDQVEAKTPLYGLEAMKMESVVEAPFAARVLAINAAVGDQVEGGADVMVLEKIEEPV